MFKFSKENIIIFKDVGNSVHILGSISYSRSPEFLNNGSEYQSENIASVIVMGPRLCDW